MLEALSKTNWVRDIPFRSSSISSTQLRSTVKLMPGKCSVYDAGSE